MAFQNLVVSLLLVALAGGEPAAAEVLDTASTRSPGTGVLSKPASFEVDPSTLQAGENHESSNTLRPAGVAAAVGATGHSGTKESRGSVAIAGLTLELSAPETADILAATKLVSDDFEDGLGDWTLFGSPTWGREYYRPNSGNSSAWCAGSSRTPPSTYTNNMNAAMIRGPFSLADATAASFDFQVWNDSEPGVDLLVYGVSVDGMYFDGEEMSGDTGGYVSRSLDLTEYLGEPEVWVGFLFASNTSTVAAGAFVDDVSVTATVPQIVDFAVNDVVLRTAAGGGGSIVTNPQPGDLLYPTVSLHYESNVPLYEFGVRIDIDDSTLCAGTGEVELPAGSENGTGWCLLPWRVSGGTRVLRATVDYLSRTAETDESNNVAVRQYEIPGDADSDGVPDESDQCFSTPQGAAVDGAGCACSQKTCSDADRCTVDICDVGTAACSNVAQPECCNTDEECVDANPCSLDHCGASGTCVHTNLSNCGACTSNAQCRAQQGCSIGFCDPVSDQCQCPDPNLYASYLALGDSIASGEGNPEFLFPTATDIEQNCEVAENLAYILCSTNKCHRSENGAYPRLLRLFGHDSIRSEVDAGAAGGSLQFRACSGATTDNVIPGGTYRYEQPQLDQPIERNTNIVTVTIGANDVGFAGKIFACLYKPFCQFTMEASANAEIDGKLERLKTTYEAIKEKTAPAPVFVMGYPQIVSGSGCFETTLPAAGLDAGEIAFIRRATSRLNGIIEQAAARAGVHFVSVEERFAGHEVCGPDQDWVRGVATWVHWSWSTEYSFHPNPYGHRAYEEALREYIQELRQSGWYGFTPLGLPRNPPPLAASFLPRSTGEVSLLSGELEIETVPDSGCQLTGGLQTGDPIRITGSGFEAFATVSIATLGPAEGQRDELTTAVAEEDGSLVAELQMVTEVTGREFVLLVAEGPASLPGATLQLSRLIRVGTDDGSDADSDGSSDFCDNCPEVANSSQSDLDQDGQGDECDPCPQDADDDLDGDGLCADEDPCPLDPLNDEDGDGVCGDEDGCPTIPDPGQEDSDADGNNDACSCVEGAICRPAVGVCDVAELCTLGECPSDGFASSAFVCRPTTGACDPAETCTGSTATCPADVVQEDCGSPGCGDHQIDEDETCDDGNTANGDGCSATCQNEKCLAETMDPGYPQVALCEDGNPCTLDSCNGALNGGTCVHQAKNCDDQIPCTIDSCQLPGGECEHLPNHSACVDSNVCSDQICSLETGCQAIANDEPCDDGNPCTTNDACSGLVCEGVPVADCGTCGNGIVDGTEQCDDGNTTFALGEYCGADCLRIPCGKPTGSSGSLPKSGDALFVLRTAVGQVQCSPFVCDVDDSGGIVASDALRVLRAAVGQDVALSCP